MKLRLLLTLPALLAAVLTHAQAYEPGLLVRANGDTLRGEIENGFWVEAPEYIRFRPAPTSPSQLFQPRQLRAVSFTNGRYFRYEALPVNHAAETRLDRLPHSNFVDMHTDSLLAEVLLEGPANLLLTAREGITHYFIRRAGQPYLELSERKYLRTTAAGRTEVADANNYRGQLEIYFGDCPTARSAVTKAAFTVQGIAAVVQAYNTGCAPAAPYRSWLAQTKPRRHLALQGGVVTGLRYNSFRNGTAELPETLPCTDCRPRPFVGLYTDVLQPGRNKALYGELSVSQFSNQAWEYFQSGPIIESSVVNYRAWLVSARLGMRFLFPLPHDQQWLLSLAYELNQTVRPTITATSGTSVIPPASSQLGFGMPTLLPSLGLGWRAQRYTLGLDAQLYTNREPSGLYDRFVGTNFVARASLAYRLGRNPDVPVR
ncbi:hypothetical protein GCM10027594_24940 [Hymenobacter agri]